MNIDKEAINVLASEFSKCAKIIMDHSSFDKTVKARVISCLDLSKNKYLIRINGCEYEALSPTPLSINDIVYVTIIQNNYSNILIRMPILQHGTTN